MILFAELEKKNPKIHMKNKRTRIAKVILNNKKKFGSIKTPDLKLHYKATEKKKEKKKT